MRIRVATLTLAILAVAASVAAAAVGTLRGVVHDPQHRPVPGATVTLASRHSDWHNTTVSDAAGEFLFKEVPIGDYTLTVTLSGFRTATSDLTIVSGSSPVIHVVLELGGVTQAVDVSASQTADAGRTVTPTTLVGRRDIERTPGADLTNSLKAVTAFVPGAYIVHDQLHVQGGHQVSWLVDGIAVPNTNIASNVGPQLDPKDMDFLEVQRGGYDASYGDRTYGVFNVSPRTGFEGNQQAELVATVGNFNQATGHFSMGSHTERLAYYGSVSGNGTDLGLDPPTADVIHDRATGAAGFGSIIFNANASNQLRIVASARRDTYQIPNTPDDEAAGVDDTDREHDVFANASWVRSINAHTVLTVSPFYHVNTADVLGGPLDEPSSATVKRRSVVSRRTGLPVGDNRRARSLGRFLRVSPERHPVDRRRLQRPGHAAGLDRRDAVGTHRGGVHSGSIRRHAAIHDQRRPARDVLHRQRLGVSGQPAHRRLVPAADRMDRARVVRPLLSGATAPDRIRAPPGLRHERKPGLHSVVRRARRPVPGGPHDPDARLVVRTRARSTRTRRTSSTTTASASRTSSFRSRSRTRTSAASTSP